MKRYQLKALTAVGVVAALIAVAGCSGTSEATTDSPVDLTFTTWVSDSTIHQVWQDLADDFRKEDPELGELTIQVIPNDEYVAQLAIQLQGGDAPDIGMVPEESVAAWVDADALYDLSSLKEDESWAWSDMLPNLVDPYEGESGELWVYPMVNNVHPVFYNKTAYEAAGVESPRDLYERGEWNWQALRESARAMADSGQTTYGFDMATWSFGGLPTYTGRAFGADYYPADGTCGYVDESTIESVEFLRDMMYTDRSFKTPGTTPNFPSGDTAMMIAPPSHQAQLVETEFDWDMVPVPGGEGAYNPILSQATIGVWAQSETPELALKLLAHLTSPEGAAAQSGTYVAARTADQEIAQKSMAEAYPGTDSNSIVTSIFEPFSSSTTLSFPVRLPEITSATTPILDGLWVEDADVLALLTEACTIAEPLLVN